MDVLTRTVTRFCAVVALVTIAAGATFASADWPVYRHDAALSGVSLGKGNIAKPEVKMSYYLGIPFNRIAQNGQPGIPTTGDLDGDGKPESASFDGRDFHVSDSTGKVVWTYHVCNKPSGVQMRIRKLLPDRKGLQVVLFTSRMDDGIGLGYCFAFDKGAASGEVAWHVGPFSGYLSPSMVVDDVDGDGQLEVVVAPHYRVQVFSGQTGAVKGEVYWEVGRNYGVLAVRPRKDRPKKDIFVICDFTLHVDCIRYEHGKWGYAWGQKYFEIGAPMVKGRDKYLHVGPNPIDDVDGDGRDEMVFMMIDAAAGDCWRLMVLDCEDGSTKADVPGIWLWSITDFNGDGKPELIYTPTKGKRPPTHSDLCVGRISHGRLTRTSVIRGARSVIMDAVTPPTLNTIADEGTRDILRADFEHDGKQVFIYTLKSKTGNFDDKVVAASIDAKGVVHTKWQLDRPGHRLNVMYAGTDGAGSTVVKVNDLTAGRALVVNALGAVTAESDIGKPGGLWTMPIAVDLDGDGANEIVVQSAAGEIVALKLAKDISAPPSVMWSVPGMAMTDQPGYNLTGALCPQAGDVDGDGRPEIVFTSEDVSGNCALTCVDAMGKLKWSSPFKSCAWGGLQAGVDNWTFGKFTGRTNGLDIYVGMHRRAKNSGEAWVFRGDTGQPVWHKYSLPSWEVTLPFSILPGVADINGDGIDDLVQFPYTIYAVMSGKTGQLIYPTAYLLDKDHFKWWVAYSSPTIADLNGDGKPEVYLNSASYGRGGYATVYPDGKPLWIEKHDNSEGSDGMGPVGDFDGDGKIEIAVGALSGRVICMNGADGSHKWEAKIPVTWDMIAADINGDGIMELISCCKDGMIRAISGKDGHEVWSTPGSGQLITADVNGDGLLEVVIVDYGSGMLKVIGQGVE
jgi:hypothetical protein